MYGLTQEVVTFFVNYISIMCKLAIYIKHYPIKIYEINVNYYIIIIVTLKQKVIRGRKND